MGLEAGDPVGAHQRVVRRAGDQFQAIALGEVDRAASHPEPDAARGNDDDLVVVVVMRPIPIARTVRPGTGLETLGDEARPEGAGLGHGRGMVLGLGM